MTYKRLENVTKRLRDAGEQVKQKPEDKAIELRSFIKNDLNTISKDLNDNNIIFISYFLNTYMEDVWSNFAVDSSYRPEITDDDVKEILASIGSKIIELADGIEAEDYYMCYTSLIGLVCEYLDQVNKIKRKIGERI